MQKLISGFLFVLLISCSGQSPVPATEFLIQTDTSQFFKKEIPTYKDGRFELFYELKKQKETQLQLDTLESGFDSLQIRIWYDYALLKNRDLIVIQRKDTTWTAARYSMLVDWDGEKETVKSKTIENVYPKSGWTSLINKLSDLGIMTLPNMDDVPGLHDNWFDGVTYNIEIATKSQYRFYGYHLPDKFADKSWQAKKMTQILDLLSSELGVKSFHL